MSSPFSTEPEKMDTEDDIDERRVLTSLDFSDGATTPVSGDKKFETILYDIFYATQRIKECDEAFQNLQCRKLFQLLVHFESYSLSSRSSSPTATSAYDNIGTTESKHFQGLRIRMERTDAAEFIHQICCDIYEVRTSMRRVLEVLISHENNCQSELTSLETGPYSPTIVDRRQTLLSNFDLAFQQPYKAREGHGAFNTFINYLDVQWAAAWDTWDPLMRRSQSICATIVQSSCTGKSRLVERLGTELLAPAVNFQLPDARGYATGYPSGDEVVISYFRDHGTPPKHLDYIEQLVDRKMNQHEDPHPRSGTVRFRFVTLAFLAGTFSTLHKYIQGNPDISISHVTDIFAPNSGKRGRRDTFWSEVVRFANNFMETEEYSRDLKIWENLASEDEKAIMQNQNHKVQKLSNNALRDEMVEFVQEIVADLCEALYQHPQFERGEMARNLKPAILMDQNIGRVRMVFMLDEAKTLVDLGYYRAFRWVLDSVIQRAWFATNLKKPLPFLAIFLGTNSKVADFLPSREDSSHRYYASFMKVPPPFTSLDWDVFVSEPYIAPVVHQKKISMPFKNKLTYYHLAGMNWLSRFGRPMWYARWSGVQRKRIETKVFEAQGIIAFAQNKLHHQDHNGSGRGFSYLFTDKDFFTDDRVLTFSAIVAVLVGLDLDFSAPKLTSELVASRLRWAVGCDTNRTFLLTTYPSEPILAEAAFRLFFSCPLKPHQPAYDSILRLVAGKIREGDYDIGGDAELGTKLLCLFARFRSLQISNHGQDITDLEWSHTGDPSLYSQCPTKVTTFLTALFNGDCASFIENNSPLWETLEHCWINFSHFTEDIIDEQALSSLEREGLFGAYLRGRAIQCKRGQPGIDIIIPMVVLPRGLQSKVDAKHISAIIIQVKNRKADSGHFTRKLIDGANFNLSHFSGLKKLGSSHPYVGIWMSFRSEVVDFAVEGENEPLVYKPPREILSNYSDVKRGKRQNSNSSETSEKRRKTDPDQDTREIDRAFQEMKVVDTQKANLAKQGKRDCLVMRVRGFEQFYNKDLPLSLIRSFVERQQFSSSIGGIHFPTDLLREETMRPIWNISTREVSITISK